MAVKRIFEDAQDMPWIGKKSGNAAQSIRFREVGHLVQNMPARIFDRHGRQAAQRRQYRAIGPIYKKIRNGSKTHF
jgi:hypothetical protein